MAYRAPELFDVKTDIPLDEKVDIWVRRHSVIKKVKLFTFDYSHWDARFSQWPTLIRLSRTRRLLPREVR